MVSAKHLGACGTIIIIGTSGITATSGTSGSAAISGNTIVCGTDGITYTINELTAAQYLKGKFQ